MDIVINGEANAKSQYPTPKHILEPQSNPTHYADLMKEIEAAPTKTWWDNFVANMKGKIRFS
jgi:cytochrome b pre-mRNA-processing protein 6